MEVPHREVPLEEVPNKEVGLEVPSVWDLQYNLLCVSNSTRAQRNLFQVVLAVPHVNEVPCCVEGPPHEHTHTRLGWHLVALQVPCREVALRGFFFSILSSRWTGDNPPHQRNEPNLASGQTGQF